MLKIEENKTKTQEYVEIMKIKKEYEIKKITKH